MAEQRAALHELSEVQRCEYPYHSAALHLTTCDHGAALWDLATLH